MIHLPEQDDNQTENYPVIPDLPFTLDEIEAIKRYKAELVERQAKTKGIKRALEAGFWGVCSYSIARYLVVVGGVSTLPLVFALNIAINNIVNRHLLDAVNVDKNDEGWKFEGLMKGLRFIGSCALGLFITYQAVGDVWQGFRQSEDIYRSIETQVDNFNRLPKQDQYEQLKIWVPAVIGAAIVGVLVGTNGGKK